MQGQAAVKFNNDFAIFPRTLYGKSKKASFSTHDGKRLSASKLMLLSYINTENARFGRLNSIRYDDFTNALGLARSTVSSGIKTLRAGKILDKTSRRSKYEIMPTLSGKSYVVIYSFLMTEELRLGGLQKKLTKNAVLYLSEIIAFYLNSANKGKYFVGGINRCAKTINVPTSTAYSVIDELLQTKAVYCKRKRLDSAGNVMLESGKGINGNITTVYILNTDILRRVKKIEAARKNEKNVKALFASSSHSDDINNDVNNVSEYRRSLRYATKSEMLDLAQKRVNELREKLKKDPAFLKIEMDRATARKELMTTLDESAFDEKCRELDERQARYLEAHNLPRSALIVEHYIH